MVTTDSLAALLRRAALPFSLALAAALAGCGGGGGAADAPTASTISGTAAAGAPLIGTVTIKDSSSPAKTKTATIAADGKYTVDVSGMTGPFMMRADGSVGGRSYSLYSAATSADVNGTVNVTPLTDLIVANIAGQIAASYFTTGNFSSLTGAALTAESTALRLRLQPVLAAAGVSASIDLLRASFNADHSGLDAALDVLRVTVDAATAKAVILNVIDNVQIVDDLASRTDTTVLPATNVAGALPEFQKIAAVFDAFTKLYATSVPASTNAALLALFTTDFLDDGQDRAAFLSQITSSSQFIGLRFSGITLQGALAPAIAPTAGTVTFTVTQQGRDSARSFRVAKVGSTWLFAGNGRIARTEAVSFARLQNGTADAGLRFQIKDAGGRGIDYAIVKGKGLPLAGLLYVNYVGNSSFGVASGPYTGQGTPHLFSDGHDQYSLSDGVVASLSDGEVYTFELWDDNGTLGTMGDDVLKATYTQALPRKPYAPSQLSASSFAAITAPTQSALTSFANAGGSIAVTWTLPSGASADSLHFFRNGSSGGDSTEVDLAAGATTGTLTMSPWNAGANGTFVADGINLTIDDAFGRELTTIFNGTAP